MWDLATDPVVARQLGDAAARGSIAAMPCARGPAALVNAKLPNGDSIVKAAA